MDRENEDDPQCEAGSSMSMTANPRHKKEITLKRRKELVRIAEKFMTEMHETGVLDSEMNFVRQCMDMFSCRY